MKQLLKGNTVSKIVALLLTLSLIFSLAACSNDAAASTSATTTTSTTQTTSKTSTTTSASVTASTTSTATAEVVEITLGDEITISGSGATAEGSRVTITAAGTYSISGTLNDGQVLVNTADSKTVKLILDGVDITCSTSAPIYIVNAEKTVITLADGSQNYITDGASYIFEDSASDEPSAAIFSNDDLTINGDGLLTVNANYNNGIQSKDDLKINGGYIVINATGDGFDVNGSIAMTDGVVIINGPTSSANGAIDYYYSFTMSGGFLVAAGSYGMAQTPSTSSTQYSVALTLSSQSAGTMIHIETEDGKEILTFAPSKTYQSVVLCSPELENGTTYIVYSGGSSTGTVSDGLYSGGTYTAGTQLTSFTISSIVTSVGSAGGSAFPGGGQMNPGGGRR